MPSLWPTHTPVLHVIFFKKIHKVNLKINKKAMLFNNIPNGIAFINHFCKLLGIIGIYSELK